MSLKKPKKILLLTSSGGNGLIQAANAKKQEVLKKHPDAIIIEKNVLKDWFGKVIGSFGTLAWNHGMTKGNIGSLKLLGKLHAAADIIFWPRVFLSALRLLIKENIDEIIDTQPLATPAIIKALRMYHLLRGKKVYCRQVISDLPTKDCLLFFRGIKNLSKKDQKYLKIVSIKPLLENGETEEDFWQKNCNASIDMIEYQDFYIRQPFLKYLNKQREDKTTTIFIESKTSQEKGIVYQTAQKGSIETEFTSEGFSFQIYPQDKLWVLLLGSQPSESATTKYVKRIIDHIKNSPQKEKIHLFVFCSEYNNEKKSLFQKIANVVENSQDYPSDLSIIPISFQSAEVIASLFFRSDLTITRSAGQTVMELMCSANGKHIIHSEIKHKKSNITQKELLLGMPAWESGCARYLIKEKAAKMVTPDTFLELSEFFN